MFNHIKAFFVKLKVGKLKKQSEYIYVYSHILLILYNNIKTMKGLTNKQCKDVFNLYIKTLFNSITSENKIIFQRALNDTYKIIDQLNHNTSTNEIQIKRQLDEIFRSGA